MADFAPSVCGKENRETSHVTGLGALINRGVAPGSHNDRKFAGGKRMLPLTVRLGGEGSKKHDLGPTHRKNSKGYTMTK